MRNKKMILARSAGVGLALALMVFACGCGGGGGNGGGGADTTAPTISGATASPASMGVVDRLPVTIQATVTDNVAVATVTATVPDFDPVTKQFVTKTISLSHSTGNTWSATYTPNTITQIFSSQLIADGDSWAYVYAVAITATDSSGNTSQPASTSFKTTGFAGPAP